LAQVILYQLLPQTPCGQTSPGRLSERVSLLRTRVEGSSWRVSLACACVPAGCSELSSLSGEETAVVERLRVLKAGKGKSWLIV